MNPTPDPRFDADGGVPLWWSSPTLTVGSTRPPSPPAHRNETGRNEAQPLREVNTPGQLADFLQVSERTLDDWRYMHKGPPFHKVGRHIRYLADEVRAWVACQ